MTFAGVRIIESPCLTEAGEPQAVRRSWRERLCSRPWRPWKATKTVVPQVPSRTVYRLAGGRLLMHPEIAREYRRALAEGGPDGRQ